MPLNLPKKRRANESKFSEFHDEIFTLLALGYSQTSILEQLKNNHPNLNSELNINSLKGYIFRQKKNPKSRFNFLKGDTISNSNNYLPTEKENIQDEKSFQAQEIKTIEHDSKPETNFSSVEKDKKLSPTELFRKKFGDTPPPVKSDDDF